MIQKVPATPSAAGKPIHLKLSLARSSIGASFGCLLNKEVLRFTSRVVNGLLVMGRHSSLMPDIKTTRYSP
jgi:hypothetical protein